MPSLQGRAKASSLVFALLFNIVLATSFTKFWNFSFLATKSVSQLISRITALLPSVITVDNPSAAILPAFLAALAIPFSLNHSVAFLI